uniref:Ion transport domain-containing protein n=1 Tax=Anopheles christyi TaxID=43041 RepID=A0A182JV13_9DIPT
NILLDSFRNRKLAVFILHLNQTKNDPICRTLRPAVIQSVFEIILSEAKSKDFIKACLEHGARADKITNHGEYPIHLAVKSLDVDNLKLLLLRKEVNVNQLSVDGKRAFDLLCDQISIATWETVAPCIALLLKNFACINVELFLLKLRNNNIPWTEVVRNCLIISNDKKMHHNQNGPTILEKHLRQQQSLLSPKALVGNVSPENIKYLLEMTIDRWKLDTAKQILQPYIIPENNLLLNVSILPSKILTRCCRVGNYEMLEYFFQILPINAIQKMVNENLLSLLVQNINGFDPECRFFKCLKLCLNCPQINIDETDGWHCTALHYAAKYRLKQVQKVLLQRGAFIGGRDIFGKFTVCEIDPQVLKQHFDSCVYTSCEEAYEKDSNSYLIFVMLNNFIPPTKKENNYSEQLTNETIDISDKSVLPALLEFMDMSTLTEKEKNARQQLIEHPVISSFLYIREPPTGKGWEFINLLPVPLILMSYFVLPELRDHIYFPIGSVLLFALFLIKVVLNFYYFNYIFHRFKQTRSFSMLNQYIVYTTLGELFLIICSGLPQKMVQVNCFMLLAGLAMNRAIASWDSLAEYIYRLEIVLMNTVKRVCLYSFTIIIFVLTLYHMTNSEIMLKLSQIELNTSVSTNAAKPHFSDTAEQSIFLILSTGESDDLLKCFEHNKKAVFIEILNTTKKDPQLQENRPTVVQSVFEFVLTQKNSKDYIKACLAHGALLNRDTAQGDYPIHLAARSLDVDNLEHLLLCKEVNVDQKQNDGKSAIDLLSEQITIDTYQDVNKCILKLLEHYASITVTNVQTILNSMHGNNVPVREIKEFIENCFLKCKCPWNKRELNDARDSIIADAVVHFENHTMSDFWKQRNQLCVSNSFGAPSEKLSKENIVYLLQMATVNFKQNAVKSFINSRLNNNVLDNVSILPPKILADCCRVGNFEILEYLLQKLPVNEIPNFFEENFLSLLVQNINESDPECPFFKCLKLCLNCPQINIDDTDGWHYTALHFACKYKLKKVQKLLLQKGAYIGGRDIFGKFTICEIDPQVLKQHFDSCVSNSYRQLNSEASGIGMLIFVMLINFVAPDDKQERDKKAMNESYKNVIPALMEFTNVSNIVNLSEATKTVRQQLIEHPVISTFIYIRDPPTLATTCLKFIRLIPFVLLFMPWSYYWIEFLEIATLLFLFLFEVILNVNYFIYFNHKNLKQLLQSVPNPSILYTMLVEIVLITILLYFKKVEINESTRLTCCILLAGFAMKRFMASWDCFAQQIYTLDIVLSNILSSFFVYSFVLVIFAQAFNFPHSNVPTEFNANYLNTSLTNGTKSSGSIINNMFDQLVMLTGELNVADKKFENDFLKIIFVCFIIVVPIALANLMIGFAVADISKLTAQSSRLKIALRVSSAFVSGQPVVKLCQYLSQCLLGCFSRFAIISRFSIFLSKILFPFLRCNDVHYVTMNTGKCYEITLHRVNQTPEMKPDILCDTNNELVASLLPGLQMALHGLTTVW